MTNNGILKCSKCGSMWADGSVKAMMGNGPTHCKRCEVKYGVGKAARRPVGPSESTSRAGILERRKQVLEAASREAARRFGSRIRTKSLRSDADGQATAGDQRGNGSSNADVQAVRIYRGLSRRDGEAELRERRRNDELAKLRLREDLDGGSTDRS